MITELISGIAGVVLTDPVRDEIREHSENKTKEELTNQKFMGGLLAFAGLMIPFQGLILPAISTAALWTGVSSWSSANKEENIREAVQRTKLST